VSNDEWWLSTVYGPSRDAEKDEFPIELRSLAQARQGPLLVGGDFNMVYQEEDKNQGRLNTRLMGQFCRCLNDAALMEIHLQGQLYTWSNVHHHPTLE
jgi:hypothetical protein